MSADTTEKEIAVSVRLPKALHDQLSKVAKEGMVHKQVILKRALEDFLQLLPSVDEAVPSMVGSTPIPLGRLSSSNDAPTRIPKDAPQA